MMELGGTEVVLGMDWLASLGDIEANFGHLVIKWKEEGNKLILKGDPSLCKNQASWKTMVKALQDEGEGYFIEYYQLLGTEAKTQTCAADVEAVLEAFKDVFQEPVGLPPRREQDHAITLKEGDHIPNVRPYRYPYYQKNEIEKIVGELLQAGIIRPSVSPFSIPVILVKKKDGGWRLCGLQGSDLL